MNNKKFMQAVVTGNMPAPTSRNRSGYKEASNVLYDGTHVYSYGSHYPLLMRLETENGTKWIRNDRGYSSSTGRHISHAGAFADGSVHLGHGMRPDYADIRKSANDELIKRRENIEALRARIAKRPYHARVYEQGIEREEARMINLHTVINMCDDAEAHAMA